MDSDHIQIRNWSQPGTVPATVDCIDLSVLEKIWISNFFQKLRMMLFEKERYLREKLGDEWRESRDKSRQAFLALLNSELPAAIPTTWEQREFDKHRLAWPGLTVPVRSVVLQWSQNWIQVANIGPRDFMISCKRNPAMTIHDLACPHTEHIGLFNGGINPVRKGFNGEICKTELVYLNWRRRVVRQ